MDIKKMYDDIADWYDILFETTTKYDYEFVDYLDLKIFHKYSVSSVLDCACGTGNQSIGLIRLGYNVTCSDFNIKMLQKAKKKAKRYNIKLNTFEANWDNLSNIFDNMRFDAVLCAGNSIYHYDSPKIKLNFLREMCAVLKQGGICFIDYERWDENYQELNRPPFKFYHNSRDGKSNLIFSSTYNHKGRKQNLTIYITVEHDGVTKLEEKKVPGYAFTTKEISELAIKAGFSKVERVRRPGIWKLNAILCIK